MLFFSALLDARFIEHGGISPHRACLFTSAGRRVQGKAWRHLHRNFCCPPALPLTYTITLVSFSASSAFMAVEAPDVGSTQQERECSLLNFIYACSICGATFADNYDGHNETVQGLSDGINPKDRLVTKLYLSGCCHVFCGEHIEGGGECWENIQHDIC